MKPFIYHLEINVSDAKKSFPFYKNLLGYFDYKVTFKKDWLLGMSNGTTDFWFVWVAKERAKNKYHRKNVGLNHFAIGVRSREEIDRFFEEFIKPRKIKPLYDTPKEFPDYEKGYYAVYFEDPDRIKVEVTYIPGFETR